MNSMTLAMSNVNVGLKQFRKMIKPKKKPKNKNEGDNKSIDRYFNFLTFLADIFRVSYIIFDGLLIQNTLYIYVTSMCYNTCRANC